MAQRGRARTYLQIILKLRLLNISQIKEENLLTYSLSQ
jgi:hypothetical protein